VASIPSAAGAAAGLHRSRPGRTPPPGADRGPLGAVDRRGHLSGGAPRPGGGPAGRSL